MKNIIALPDLDIVGEIGKYIKHERLRQNKSQEELATHAGIKRLTLSRMENGGTFSIVTLIQLLRSLDVLEDVMELFRITNITTPTMYLKMQKKARRRAGYLKKNSSSIQAILENKENIKQSNIL